MRYCETINATGTMDPIQIHPLSQVKYVVA